MKYIKLFESHKKSEYLQEIKDAFQYLSDDNFRVFYNLSESPNLFTKFYFNDKRKVKYGQVSRQIETSPSIRVTISKLKKCDENMMVYDIIKIKDIEEILLFAIPYLEEMEIKLKYLLVEEANKGIFDATVYYKSISDIESDSFSKISLFFIIP